MLHETECPKQKNVDADSSTKVINFLSLLMPDNFRLTSVGAIALHFEGPAKGLKAIVTKRLMMFYMEQAYIDPANIAGEYMTSRRRVSFRLELKPDSYFFSHVDEQWEADGALNVDNGIDTETTVSGRSKDIRNVRYDSTTRTLIIDGNQDIIKNLVTERRSTGRHGTYPVMPSLTKDARPKAIFACGDFSVVFNILK